MMLTLRRGETRHTRRHLFAELTTAAALATSLVGLSACSVHATAESGPRPRMSGMADGAAPALGRAEGQPNRNVTATPNPTPESSRRSAYSVELSAQGAALATAGSTTRTSITVRNTGADIPALSVLFEAPAVDWNVVSVRSDRPSVPEEVLAPRGRGWDFGPLRHGAVIHVTLTIEPRRPGHGAYRLCAYAVAEDEGDVMRSIDQHIAGSDRLVSVWVRPRTEVVKT